MQISENIEIVETSLGWIIKRTGLGGWVDYLSFHGVWYLQRGSAAFCHSPERALVVLMENLLQQ